VRQLKINENFSSRFMRKAGDEISLLRNGRNFLKLQQLWGSIKNIFSKNLCVLSEFWGCFGPRNMRPHRELFDTIGAKRPRKFGAAAFFGSQKPVGIRAGWRPLAGFPAVGWLDLAPGGGWGY